MTAFYLNTMQPIDPKRDEIRRYLERGSVLDSLTKIFIRVIKERPENPMEYIRNNIGVVRHQHDKYERLSQDLQEANEEIQRLRAIINSINPEVLQGQSQHAAGESDSEPVTVAVQVEDSLESEITQEVKQGIPEVNKVENAAVDKADKELSAALDDCHIEENNMAAGNTTENTKHSISVQAEPGHTDNTE